MKANEARLRENFPTILMTMISLIVGLLYENLVSAVQGLDGLWTLNHDGFFMWVQCFTLVVSPLLFWFTYSLNSSAVRAVFVPRLALVPIVAGSGLFFFVSNIGAEYATAWLYAWAVIVGSAWVAFREFAGLYVSDEDAPGDANSHNGSAGIMVCLGLVLLIGGVLVQLGVIGSLGAGIILLSVQLGGIYAHRVWYGEWKLAVGISDPDSVVGAA